MQFFNISFISSSCFNKSSDNIYKGEITGEDLSDKSEDYIWEHLKDKIYDFSVKVLFGDFHVLSLFIPLTF